MDYLPLGGRRKGFMPRVSVLFLITHHVLSLCLHLSSLNLCHLISTVDMILFGVDCLSILCHACVHIPHINCLTLMCGFTPRASVSFSITHHVLSLCLHLSFLNLCHLISIVDVILFGVDCLSILCYACVHIPHINCLTLSLNW